MVILTTLTCLVLATLRFGSRPERYAIAIIATWIVVDQSYHLLVAPPTFSHVDPFHVVVDGVTFLGMLLLALAANRIWPLWMAAAQLVVLFGHFAAMTMPGGMQRAYWAMTQLPIAIQIVALLFGILWHQFRLRQIGTYSDWRPDSDGAVLPPN